MPSSIYGSEYESSDGLFFLNLEAWDFCCLALCVSLRSAVKISAAIWSMFCALEAFPWLHGQLVVHAELVKPVHWLPAGLLPQTLFVPLNSTVALSPVLAMPPPDVVAVLNLTFESYRLREA